MTGIELEESSELVTVRERKNRGARGTEKTEYSKDRRQKRKSEIKRRDEKLKRYPGRKRGTIWLELLPDVIWTALAEGGKRPRLWHKNER